MPSRSATPSRWRDRVGESLLLLVLSPLWVAYALLMYAGGAGKSRGLQYVALAILLLASAGVPLLIIYGVKWLGCVVFSALGLGPPACL
ncbi:hypothetical protein [Tahibacter amnicola]|uniref:Uncharacterized protein n=1 Tax=Tahibacter amnicola TaxID=2976241 RepID=A0ABY6BGW2_9GAMM|nr:hypothetical protein [Tahibacter amnicola]UXI69259.1 hypothetical protein N4264_06310 [Tahibacter amnicola]